MAISKKILNLIKSNDKVGLPIFLNGLPAKEEEKFWAWFGRNANEYRSDLGCILPKNIKCIPSNCYGNAQYNAKKLNLDYCEGAFFLADEDNYIMHGFNAYNDIAVDYTIIGNPDVWREYDELPVLYYGVKIPIEFVKKYIDESAPILTKYFQYLRTV